MRNKNQKGFSLIELLIVISILLVLAASAIPSLMHAVRSSQESAMVSSLRTLSTGVRQYQNTFPYGTAATVPADFSAVTLADMGNGGTPGACNTNPNPTPTVACIIDDTLSAGSKGPYTISLSTPFTKDGQVFEFRAVPTTAGSPLKS